MTQTNAQDVKGTIHESRKLTEVLRAMRIDAGIQLEQALDGFGEVLLRRGLVETP